MPLDHFVPQVHLRKFYSPELGEQLHALRKSDMKYFTPGAKAVCAVVDGSTNAYLREDRLIEAFLKSMEPNYNIAVSAFGAGAPDQLSIYTLSGFIAFVSSCSPAAMRIHAKPIADSLEGYARALDMKGIFPLPPEALGGKSLTELLNSGDLKFTVDKKYPQAFGIRQILEKTSMFGNLLWEVLVNPFEDSPFFTSDFPTAFEKTHDLRVLNRVVPLSPTLAVRVLPDLRLERKVPDFSFPKFRFRRRILTRGEVMYVNRLIVRCAETIVFYRDNHDWIETFVRRNARYRVEPRTHRIPDGTGILTVFTHEVSEISSEQSVH